MFDIKSATHNLALHKFKFKLVSKRLFLLLFLKRKIFQHSCPASALRASHWGSGPSWTSSMSSTAVTPSTPPLFRPRIFKCLNIKNCEIISKKNWKISRLNFLKYRFVSGIETRFLGFREKSWDQVRNRSENPARKKFPAKSVRFPGDPAHPWFKANKLSYPVHLK